MVTGFNTSFFSRFLASIDLIFVYCLRFASYQYTSKYVNGRLLSTHIYVEVDFAWNLALLAKFRMFFFCGPGSRPEEQGGGGVLDIGKVRALLMLRPIKSFSFVCCERYRTLIPSDLSHSNSK